MAALIKTRDPRRLFQDPAARLWLGVDQFRDLPLPHQRRGLRPGGGVREQHLDVARAHILGVHLVRRSDVAGDPAHDVDLVTVVKARRRQPFGVVDAQRDLGEIPRRATCGPGKDHVFHPAAAHRGRAIFAHHPTERLQQVGLATAVRPHDTGQPVVDHELCRIDKALEARESDLGETQNPPARFRLNPQGGGAPVLSQRPAASYRGSVGLIHKILQVRHGKTPDPTPFFTRDWAA